MAIPVLGAVTPALCFYAYSFMSYLLLEREEDAFIVEAMWGMTFFTYCLLVIAGLFVGWRCPAGVNNYWRFGIGLVAGPLAVVLFLVLERMFL